MDNQQTNNSNPFPSNIGTDTFGTGIPVNEENQMLQSLVSEKNVPKDFLKKYWWVFARDIPLTFLDPERKNQKLLAFDIAAIDLLNTTKYYDYDFNLEHDIGVARNIYDFKLDRALGTTNAKQINERIVQRTQFSDIKQAVSDSTRASVKDGFLARMFGRGR